MTIAGVTAAVGSSTMSAGGIKRKGREGAGMMPQSSTEDHASKRVRKTARMSTGGKAPRSRQREKIIDLTGISND
jgi:hypothetical protein